MSEIVYVASPAEIEARRTLYWMPIINWKAGWYKVVESKPLGTESKQKEHSFKKFK